MTTSNCNAYGGGNDPACTTPTTNVTTTTHVGVGTPVHSMPFTGSDALGLGVVASLLIAAGAALIRGGRRNRAL